MKEQLKGMARPYAMRFSMALAVALVGRIGLAAMDLSGALAYDYISASGVPILDVVCSILTGSAFMAFLFLAALVMVLSTAGVALHGLLFARGVPGAGKPATAFLWGWATAFAAIVCLFVVPSGILSGVQVHSMSSKLTALKALLVALVARAAVLGTRLGDGIAVASDTGSAIKGPKLDLWFDSCDDACSFGRRYCTVYVLN